MFTSMAMPNVAIRLVASVRFALLCAATGYAFDNMHAETSRNRLRFVTTVFYDDIGIGNELFIYASLLGISVDMSLTPIVATNRKPAIYDAFDGLSIPFRPNTSTSGWTRNYAERCAKCYTNYTDSIRAFATSEATGASGIILDGYHQSWKYFAKLDGRLRSREFAFSATMKASGEDRVSQIRQAYCPVSSGENCLVIGIHDRRGDMASARLVERGYLVADVGYFNRTMAYYAKKFPLKTIIFAFVSNDIAWGVDHLRAFAQGPLVFVKPESAISDLCFLASCDHLILTVGTYGWWAGFLGKGNVTYLKEQARKGSWLDSQTVLADHYMPHWLQFYLGNALGVLSKAKSLFVCVVIVDSSAQIANFKFV